MLIAARNAILAGGAALPYDAEVEYLESNNSQWIDTGEQFDYSSDMIFNVAVAAMSTARHVVIGNFSGQYTPCMNIEFGGVSNNKPLQPRFYFTVGQQGTLQTVNELWFGQVPLDSKVDLGISYAHSSRKCDCSVGSSTQTIYIPNKYGVQGMNLRLFADSRTNMAQIRMYACSMKKNGQNIRDFIPVRFTNELGIPEGAMFDKVSGTLFRNRGTGAFVIGPDASAANGGRGV